MPSNPNAKNYGANTGTDDDQSLDFDQMVNELKAEGAIDKTPDEVRAAEESQEISFTSLAQEGEQQPESGEQVSFRSALRTEVGDDDITQVRKKPDPVIDLTDEAEEIIDEDDEPTQEYKIATVSADRLPTDDELTAEYLGKAKGFDVVFPRSDNSTQKGKLIEWRRGPSLLVVGADAKTGQYVRKRIAAEKLYALNPGLKKRLEDFDDLELRAGLTGEMRERFTSLLEDYERKTVIAKEINNGGRAETLDEGIRLFEMQGGIEGAAATCIGGYKYEKGKDGQPKNRNEDCWIVNPQTNFAGVVDALGDGSMGVTTSETVATNIAENENDVALGVKKAKEKLAANPEIGAKDGAVFLTIKALRNKQIEATQAGDADLYHFGANGEEKFSPDKYIEAGNPPQSLLGQLEKLPNNADSANLIRAAIKHVNKEMTEEKATAMEQIIARLEAGQKPIVEQSNPLYTGLRRVATMGINKERSDVVSYKTGSTFEGGDWVLVMSDGISDNFRPDEIQAFVKRAIAEGLNPERLTQIISVELDRRIRLKANNDPEAVEKFYKTDNATLIVMRAKPQAAPAVAQPAVA